jgi:hypothetical protein
MMRIKISDWIHTKPKNYSRKLNECSCLVPIYLKHDTTHSDYVTIKYKIELNKDKDKIKFSTSLSQYQYRYFGKFKEIIEMPEIFSILSEEDFVIIVSYFTRDGIQVPFVCKIEIENDKKYQQLKNNKVRKQKLNKLKL